MFVDLLPFETNRLLVHFAAFGSILCLAAYVTSKFRSAQALATALTRYAQAVAIAIMLFMSLSTACLMICGLTSPQQLTARASTSFSAWGDELTTFFDSQKGEGMTDLGSSGALKLETKKQPA